MKWDHVFWLVRVLPCSRDNFTTPEDLNPLCQHVPPLLQGDLGVNMPVVELEVMQHVGVPRSGSQVADFFVVGLERSRKVVDTGAGSGELLGGDGGASLHCSGKPIGHCACDLAEFVPAEADEGFSRSGGKRGIGLALWWRVEAYSEWGW
jgi:hypothetical protein